jgi:short-subunit dehydrogenase
LVNNVGVYNPELFLNISYAKIKTETILNTIPMTIMSRIFIPIMKQRYIDFKKRSAIINVASGSCQSLLYGTANYCATKAYEDLLTRSLATEYRNYHIDFMSLRPYLVTSSMTYGEKSLLHVTGEECAKGALKDLGRSLVSYGHWKHRIQGVLIEELNGKIVQWFMCLKNKQLLMRYKELGYTGK